VLHFQAAEAQRIPRFGARSNVFQAATCDQTAVFPKMRCVTAILSNWVVSSVRRAKTVRRDIRGARERVVPCGVVRAINDAVIR
jgi:hypothetical protein